CGWTLDQLCGLAPIPRLPEAPWTRWYSPVGTARPAWLEAGLRTSSDERNLAALIVAWQDRGARLPHIAQTLNAWGARQWGRRSPWTPASVTALVGSHTMWTKQGRKELQALGVTTDDLLGVDTKPRTRPRTRTATPVG